MIIIKLNGGLGNQLFQYALGRNLSIKLATELKLDTSSLGVDWGHHHTVRYYGLEPFNIHATIATDSDLRNIGVFGGKLALKTLSTDSRSYFIRPFRQIARRWVARKSLAERPYVLEPHFYFSPEVMSVKDGTYLEGFWQTEKYFKDIRPIILKDFTLKNGFSPAGQAFADEMNRTESIALHIRRGDAVHNPRGHSFHGFCSNEYYIKGVEEIASRLEKSKGKDVLKNLTIFVFSDEIQWVKDNLKLPYPTRYVSAPGMKDYEELVLISKAKHQIISNSTFSWWGAWLNENPDKIVVSPKNFFVNTSLDTRDLLPETWVLIDSSLL
jgi:hypothetical protein